MDCADEIFKIAERYKKIKRINIETISYQEMLRDYVHKRSKREGKFLPGIEMGIKGYGNQKKKDRLFEGLQPMFKAGAVHLKKDMHEFIGELLDLTISNKAVFGFNTKALKIQYVVEKTGRINHDHIFI